MKLRNKLFILCMTLCLSVISLTSVVIIESGSFSAYQSELDHFSREIANMKTLIAKTLLTESQADRLLYHGEPIRNGADIIVQTVHGFPDLRSDIDLLSFFTSSGKMIAANDNRLLDLGRAELGAIVGSGRGRMIDRRTDAGHYLLMFEIIDALGEKYVLFAVRDVGFLDEQRLKQYVIFALVAAVSLAALALVTALLSKRITKPIESLTAAASVIAAGDYTRRAEALSRDEISLLAAQFNRMAGEIEKRLAALNAQAAEKQRFIDNLTHELKNPLTSIIGYANLLLTAKFDEEIFCTGLEYIRSEGRRILDLTERMFDLILHRDRPLQYSRVELPGFVREIADLMKFKLEEKSVTLRTETGPGTLSLDRELMKAAVINIVDNAIKASEAGGRVRLFFGDRGGAPCLAVEDEGKGIPAGDLDKVTEPFYRVHKTRSPEEKGIGLGLAITNEIVRLHGARLVIQSEPGRGTRVCVHF